LVEEIFEIKRSLLADYRQLYVPVQKFISLHSASKDQGALEFSASIAVEGFVDGLLGMINQGRKGTFQGRVEGRERLQELVDAADLETFEGVRSFLSSVEDALTHDRGDEKGRPVAMEEQLVDGATKGELLDYLYGLEYLVPKFELRWQHKTLDQLSPGERGNLLLVFYLLIDQRDCPLVVDQPEENLDNETVATQLVPAIKFAKQRRQIVIVTHNPNLAVVCDAEQVIHAQMDKGDGNAVTYSSGSIENREITQKLVDVLEGTKPAFDKRDARYEALDH
jgi:hypothetical protein